MELKVQNNTQILGRQLLLDLNKTNITQLKDLYGNGKVLYKNYKNGMFNKNKATFLSTARNIMSKTADLARGVVKTEISVKINTIYSILIRQAQQLGAIQLDNLSLKKLEKHMEAYNNLLELMNLLIENARL